MEARAADIAPLKRTELTDDRIGMYLSPVVVLVREWLHANRSFAQRGVLHPWSDKSVVRNFSELGRVGIDDEAGEPAAGKRPDESQWSKKSVQLSLLFRGSAATAKVVARIQDRPDAAPLAHGIDG